MLVQSDENFNSLNIMDTINGEGMEAQTMLKSPGVKFQGENAIVEDCFSRCY